jgi:hypothetical protein
MHLGAHLKFDCQCKPAPADSRGTKHTSKGSGRGLESHANRAESATKGAPIAGSATEGSAWGICGRVIASTTNGTGSVTFRHSRGQSHLPHQQDQAAAGISCSSSSSCRGGGPGKQPPWGSWTPDAAVTLQQLELRALAEAEDARHQLQPADAAPWQEHPELQQFSGACHWVCQLSCTKVSTAITENGILL